MANTNNPFGFAPYGTLSGSGPNFRLTKRLIQSSNTGAIYSGDSVSTGLTTAAGYIVQSGTGTGGTGIFMGCEYLSVSQGNIVRSRFWPGADANGDATAYVIDNPDALFVVQSGSTACGLAQVGLNANLIVGTGSTITGQSGMTLDVPTTTNILPFIVVGMIQDPAGQNGTDITTGYNWVIVGWNSQTYKYGQTAPVVAA